MSLLLLILAIIVSYLIGSVPFGLIFSRQLSGVDVRTVGSGNIGATNVLRVAGKTAAVLTLLADALKGLIPVLLAKYFIQDEAVTALSGVAVILGHNYSLYLKFKGGKGVATSYGVVLAVDPLAGVLCLITWMVVAYIWRYSSLSAIISFACYAGWVFLAGSSSSQNDKVLALFIFGTIYYRHRENIRQLLSGTEPRIGQK
jgi:glycerol-3-phosphate acyltransferase PlsY